MQIVRTTLFTRSLKKLGATAKDIENLEAEIAANPEAGEVIKGLGGLRKIRFSMKGRGKRGGGRAIYLVLWVHDVAYLILAYDKSVQDDLSEVQRQQARAFVRDVLNEKDNP